MVNISLKFCFVFGWISHENFPYIFICKIILVGASYYDEDSEDDEENEKQIKKKKEGKKGFNNFIFIKDFFSQAGDN